MCLPASSMRSSKVNCSGARPIARSAFFAGFAIIGSRVYQTLPRPEPRLDRRPVDRRSMRLGPFGEEGGVLRGAGDRPRPQALEAPAEGFLEEHSLIPRPDDTGVDGEADVVEGLLLDTGDVRPHLQDDGHLRRAVVEPENALSVECRKLPHGCC